MESAQRRPALSTVLIVAICVVIILVATGTYAFLSMKPATASSSTTATTTALSESIVLNGTTSAGFFGQQLVAFGYTAPVDCTPGLATFATNVTEATAASAKTPCEVGGGDASAVPDAAPVFILVPAYAGLSIFGLPSLGATSQGYPTFDKSLVFTQCGAGGTVSACADHPSLLYSPVFTLVEHSLGITKGTAGLPEGVLPTPAHDHVVDYTGGPSIPWYVIAVLVFDPNIMPNAATGQCTQLVGSNLTQPTTNCLTSFSALSAAMSTRTTATANANSTQNDPIYDALGGPSTQVLIPGVTAVTDNSPANTNLFLYFSVASNNPYNK